MKNTTQHNTTQHNTTQHNTTQHNTTQHNQSINNIVWWIPIKKLRDCIRVILTNIYDIEYLKKDINEIKDSIIKNDEIKTYSNNIYEYDFIFSIGTACQCASMLKYANIRKFSGVFDWSYGGNIYNTLNIINSKFNNFFNKEDLIAEKMIHPNNQELLHYFNKRTSLFYIHDFSQDQNKFDEEYLEINNKYSRRISRTINYLYNQKVLMVYITKEMDNEDLIDIKKIINKIYDIRKTYNNNNIDLLFIRHYKYKQNKIFFNSFENDMLHIYDLNNRPSKNDKFSMCNINKTLEILKQYKIKE